MEQFLWMPSKSRGIRVLYAGAEAFRLTPSPDSISTLMRQWIRAGPKTEFRLWNFVRKIYSLYYGSPMETITMTVSNFVIRAKFASPYLEEEAR